MPRKPPSIDRYWVRASWLSDGLGSSMDQGWLARSPCSRVGTFWKVTVAVLERPSISSARDLMLVVPIFSWFVRITIGIMGCTKYGGDGICKTYHRVGFLIRIIAKDRLLTKSNRTQTFALSCTCCRVQDAQSSFGSRGISKASDDLVGLPLEISAEHKKKESNQQQIRPHDCGLHVDFCFVLALQVWLAQPIEFQVRLRMRCEDHHCTALLLTRRDTRSLRETNQQRQQTLHAKTPIDVLASLVSPKNYKAPSRL